MKYLSVTETSEKWGITSKRIQVLCTNGRIKGAIKIGYFWAIPANAEKSADARIKSGRYINSRSKRADRAMNNKIEEQEHVNK